MLLIKYVLKIKLIIIIIIQLCNNSIDANQTIESKVLLDNNIVKWLKVSESAVLDCPLNVTKENLKVFWRTNRGIIINDYIQNDNIVFFTDGSEPNINISFFEFQTYDDCERIKDEERFLLLNNGSLLIRCVTRKDGGNFTCSLMPYHLSLKNISFILENRNYSKVNSTIIFESVKHINSSRLKRFNNENSLSNISNDNFTTSEFNAYDSIHNISQIVSNFYIKLQQSALNFTEINSNLSFDDIYFTLLVRLNYSTFSCTEIESIIMGLVTAGSFFVVACILGIIRYLSHICSKKEKIKRKSIKEVLSEIMGFRAAAAKIDKFTAYRSAKIDRFLEVKSSYMDQLSAYRTSRIDRLRTYKQASVAAILSHLDRMREHYSQQSTRIRENCIIQVENLKESYDFKCHKFKDYRSQKADRLRDNYQAQLSRIRDYSQAQLGRLRDQYKAQQLHVLKLLELIDVGNCLTIVEAECLRAESVIFSETPIIEIEPFSSLQNFKHNCTHDCDIDFHDEFNDIDFPDDFSADISLEDFHNNSFSSRNSKIVNSLESLIDERIILAENKSNKESADRTQLRLDLVSGEIMSQPEAILCLNMSDNVTNCFKNKSDTVDLEIDNNIFNYDYNYKTLNTNNKNKKLCLNNTNTEINKNYYDENSQQKEALSSHSSLDKRRSNGYKFDLSNIPDKNKLQKDREENWLAITEWNKGFLDREDLWNCFVDTDFELGSSKTEVDDCFFGLTHDYSLNGSIILKPSTKIRKNKAERFFTSNLSPKKILATKLSPKNKNSVFCSIIQKNSCDIKEESKNKY